MLRDYREWLDGEPGRYPFNKGNHLIVAAELFAYGDESGQNLDQEYAVVAALVAPPLEWDSFNDEWQRVIKKAEVTEFHSKYFFGRQHHVTRDPKAEFDGWTDSKAKRLLDGLLSVIAKHRRIRPIESILATADFRDFTWGERIILTGGSWDPENGRFAEPPQAPKGTPRHPLSFVFFNMVGAALEIGQPDDVKVHFRMDVNKVISQKILPLYESSRVHPQIAPALREKLGDLLPGHSHEHPGIQAADLLAHLKFSYYSRQEKLSGEREYAISRLPESWRQLHIIKKRGLELIVSRSVSAEEREKIRAIEPPPPRRRGKKAPQGS